MITVPGGLRKLGPGKVDIEEESWIRFKVNVPGLLRGPSAGTMINFPCACPHDQ